jgi:hypothetical protein
LDSGRYLSFDEREQIALWRAENRGVREIARQLNHPFFQPDVPVELSVEIG